MMSNNLHHLQGFGNAEISEQTMGCNNYSLGPQAQAVLRVATGE